MSSESAVTPHSILEKFEFYFLGLTFTLLGAAIQTAAFTGHSHVSVITEIIGWAGFAISGLVGLSKVEHLSVVIYLRNRKNEFENAKSQFEEEKAYPVLEEITWMAGRTGKIIPVANFSFWVSCFCITRTTKLFLIF